MNEIVIPALPDPSRSAEIVPHPAWSRRIADDVQRQLYGASPSWQRKVIKDAITGHRKRLEQIGVAENRIDAEISALESSLFPVQARRRA
jgi:hypothetical protein